LRGIPLSKANQGMRMEKAKGPDPMIGAFFWL
jgi:hypothetical protein